MTDNIRGIARLPAVRKLIELALEEDLGRGDVTTESVIGDDGTRAEGSIVARQDLVVAGSCVAAAVFYEVDPTISVAIEHADGSAVTKGTHVIRLAGPANTLLSAERTALNFMQRLCGVATYARRYADAVAGTETRVVDTRKTTPGWRVLQKAAVLAGGCYNHRFDLGSGVLIKDNHVAACGSVRVAVERARDRAPHSLRIEVEVETLDQLDEAIAARADVVLLDNMTTEQVKIAAAKAKQHGILVEVSGGIVLENVADYARAGADIISVGALTHSAPSCDLALDFDARS